MYLHIDLETYSDVDIGKCGLYKYVDSDAFEILLFGYAYDDGHVSVIDLTAQNSGIPEKVVDDLTDPAVVKVAHNASFERICLSKYLGVTLRPEEWHCTMIHGAMLGLPMSLKDAGNALGLEEDKKKLATGKALITYFCKPCKPTKANGGRRRNLPADAPNKWALFIDYNRRDVESEQEIFNKLEAIRKIPKSEKELYCIDQRINDYGLAIDEELLDCVLEHTDMHTNRLKKEADDLSPGINVNSMIQLRKWLLDKFDISMESLTKADVKNLLGRSDLPEEARQMLTIRQEIGKTSVKKYDMTKRALCSDRRMHGTLQFYGAGRTGRWAGRLLQVQNLPRNAFGDIGLARSLVKKKDFEAIDLLYGSVNDVFSTLIRTLIVPTEGKVFAVADYSAIEARVIAWLANETWRQEAFKNGEDIYCKSASKIYGVPVVKHGINGHLRQKGKVAELACGYGGGVGAMKRMDYSGAVPEEEYAKIVSDWRKASPHIVMLWKTLESCMKETILKGIRTSYRITDHDDRLTFEMVSSEGRRFLIVTLPSGRYITYDEPRVEEGEYGGQIVYMGQNQTTKKWEKIKTYGGKITENVVQSIARDCLGVTLSRIEKAGYQAVMHVHDEIITEVPNDDPKKHLEQINAIFAEPITWAPGLILVADGFTADYYRKD